MPPKKVDAESRRSSRSPTPLRNERGTSPVNVKQFKKIMGNLNSGQFTTLHQLPDRPMNARHYVRRAIIGGLLGLGGGLGYYFRQPLLKLGQKAYNYGLDKFHNLFQSNNTSSSKPVNPNLHHA